MKDLAGLKERLEKSVPDKCWAIMAPDWASPPNYIYGDTARSRASEAREYFAIIRKRLGESPERAWRRAYREGWRVVRVQVSALTDKDEGGVG